MDARRIKMSYNLCAGKSYEMNTYGIAIEKPQKLETRHFVAVARCKYDSFRY
jgi:hypothetical protein